MAIARDPYTVLDCPDPAALARFYGGLLDWPVIEDDPAWAAIAHPEQAAWRYDFQRVEGFRAPEWPGQEHPQQFHIDVFVDDLDEAEAATLALGAAKHAFQPSERDSFRVFLDPAGHPFCLCQA